MASNEHGELRSGQQIHIKLSPAGEGTGTIISFSNSDNTKYVHVRIIKFYWCGFLDRILLAPRTIHKFSTSQIIAF